MRLDSAKSLCRTFVRAVNYADHVAKVGDLRRAVNSQWRLIVSITVACTALATVLPLVMTPVYRSTALLVPVSQEQKNQGLSAIAGQFGGLAQLTGLDFGSSSKD